MATIVDVLSSVITSIDNVAQLVKDSITKVDTRNDALIAILNDRFKSIEERDKKLAAGMQKMYETILEMQEQIENNSSSDSPTISAEDMDKLMGMLKTEKSEKVEKVEKVEMPTQKKAKVEPKAEQKAEQKAEPKEEPKEEPEDVDEEIDEEEAEEASENESSPNEIKSIFQSKSTGRQRIICMNYLKEAGRKSECRMPDKLTWDYCSGIKKDEDDSKPAMEQWLAFVVEYDKQNG